MASRIEIANLALTHLGQPPVMALDDGSVAANTINTLFDPAVAALLRAHVWNFAKARANLPAMAENPAFGYTTQYQLPGDCLRVVRVGQYLHALGTTGYYSIEQGRILINQTGPLPVQYVQMVDDAARFDALFVDVLAVRLALDACERLTQSNTKKQILREELEQALRRARRANAIERPAVATIDDTWMQARL